MIKTVIKRDGRKEAFDPVKLNAWGQWAAETLGSYVDWTGIVQKTVSSLSDECSTQKLQEQLIRTCLDKETWSYYRMAGRLYAALLQKQLYPKGIPTIKELHKTLVEKGLMEDLGYSNEEYTELEKVIDHTLDHKDPHFALHYTRQKYAIQNRVSKEEFETQQFVYMRMAMAVAKNESKGNRLDKVKSLYNSLSKKQVSAPTPAYVNLGTKHKGFNSCCLYAAGDTLDSLAVGDHIAYMMTAASAGIGGNIMSRSIGDPVRGGAITHLGKAPLYAVVGKAVKAMKQGSRGGALTTYYTGFDPEASNIVLMRNPRSTEDRRNRDLHYAIITNRFFAEKAAKNEEAFMFNPFTAPKLSELLYSGDYEEFKKEYEKLDKNPWFVKEYFNPRDLIISQLNEALETGVAYLFNADNANSHTPFKDPIHSSNLCVAPETMLLTDKGNIPIAELEGEYVNVWNGHDWSNVLVVKTGENQELIKVVLSSGKEIECTPYHKFYTVHRGEVRAIDLQPQDEITNFVLPDCLNTWYKDFVVEVVTTNRIDDTYCVNEPKRNRVVFNGILTGNCVEVYEPTVPYDSMKDLYSKEDVGYITIKNSQGVLIKYTWSEEVEINCKEGFAGEVKVGDTINGNEVVEITDSKKEPEVAMCSLNALVYPNISDDDEEYAEAMYNALKMADYYILESYYPLPHIKNTATKRMNAGIGLIGVATHMAKKGLKYDTPEGLQELHKIAERHMYHAIKASLRISKERGNAPWINRTKWVDGWLPIDTYNKNVDIIGDFKYNYDWEALRKEVKDNGGIAHSCLVAVAPTESSSKSSAQPNSVYPVRDTTLSKTDGFITVRWAAPNSDNPRYLYQSAWDVSQGDMIKAYAVMQKFFDQGISADLWRRIKDDDKVSSRELLSQYFDTVKFGMKGRYYFNSNVSNGNSLEDTQSINDFEEDSRDTANRFLDESDCEACTL